jgi:hypothetical protein
MNLIPMRNLYQTLATGADKESRLQHSRFGQKQEIAQLCETYAFQFGRLFLKKLASRPGQAAQRDWLEKEFAESPHDGVTHNGQCSARNRQARPEWLFGLQPAVTGDC